jgi:hypothetical protein
VLCFTKLRDPGRNVLLTTETGQYSNKIVKRYTRNVKKHKDVAGELHADGIWMSIFVRAESENGNAGLIIGTRFIGQLHE